MNLNMYTIRDSASEAYTRPFFARAHGEAIRNFENEIKREGPLQDHPEHFSLWFVGSFDDNTGVFQLAENGTVAIIKAIDFAKE